MRDKLLAWETVQRNASYWCEALPRDQGMEINWHSPANERSSQIICISALCGLRGLPDRDEIIARLFEPFVGAERAGGPWRLTAEHSNRHLLGETGGGTPTCVDIFCESPSAVVCVEGKFHFDAHEGFGGCWQARTKNCAGHHGPGSDRKTGTSAPCRLEVADGRRQPRRYWDLARPYFQDTVFRQQAAGEACPFAGSGFQLMRNFLFAAYSATEDRNFAVVCFAPSDSSSTVRRQTAEFRSMLREPHQSKVGVRSYDELADLLRASTHEQSRKLGDFLHERLTTLR